MGKVGESKPLKMKTKPSKKTKLEANILSKSKRFIQEKNPSTPTVSMSSTTTKRSHPPPAANVDVDIPTSAKRRKPRHATVEGQRFIKAKERAIALEWAGSSLTPSTKSATKKLHSTDEPSKKRKKKKKGKSKKGTGGDVNNAPGESDERYRKEALSYLQLWKEHKDHWKFEKLKQVWLLKHALDSLAVDEPCFQSLLEYVGSIQGASRDKTRTEMEEFMKQFEMTFALGKQTATEGQRKEYDRARQIIQMLAE